MKCKRTIAALLLLAMLLSCLPLGVLAAEQGSGNYFYLSAQTTRTSRQLLIRPAKVYYAAGESIAQALLNSGYSFAGLDAQYSKMITGIQNVSGNFTFCGDFPKSVTLLEQADSIRFLYFSEDTDAQMTDALQRLMQVTADYLDKPADVQAAAKTAYDDALAKYPGQTDTETAALADELSSAIKRYEDSLTERYSVTVTASEPDCEITAVNEYGREFSASGNTLLLPRGTYTIAARIQNRIASRKDVTVSGPDSVSLTLPTGSWFNEAGFQLSRTYESMGAEDGSRFTDGLCVTDAAAQQQAHTVIAQIPDAYAGELYPHVPKAAGMSNEFAMTVSYRKTDGSAVTEQEFAAGSYVTPLRDAVRLGTEGNEAVFRLSREAEGCIQSMELKLVLARVPTLKSLRVENADGVVQAADLAFSPLTQTYTYRIVDTAAVKLRLETTTAGSTITVTSGNAQYTPDTDGSVRVPVSGNTDILVTVASGGYSMVYTLKLQPNAGKNVRFVLVNADELEIRNKNGEVLGYTSEKNYDGTVTYTYTLVPKEKYSYVATKDTWYHTKKTFLADDDSAAASAYRIRVNAGDWMQTLALGSSSASGNKGNVALSPAFEAGTHRYTATVSDATNALYVWTGAEWTNITAIYPVQSTSRDELPAEELLLTDGKETGTKLPEALLSGSGHGNTVTFRVAQYDSGNDVTNYVDYAVELRRALSLRALSVSRDGETVPLYRSDGTTTGYIRTETAYSVQVPAAAASLELTVLLQSGKVKYGETGTGYAASVNGETLPADGQISVPLHGGTGDETIRVVLTNEYAPGAETVYTIQVRKAQTQQVRFNVTPSGALVYIYETVSGSRVWPEGDTFALCEGFSYQCAVTKNGYVGQSGALTLEDGVLSFCGNTYTELGRISVALDAAKPDGLRHELTAYWPSFRGNDQNNAVTAAATPIRAEEGTRYWAAQIGKGHSSGAVSNPILVNGELVVYAGTTILRVDKDTGEVLKTGKMAGASDFAINGPTYADGMLLVGLAKGRIQAFDAVTLESLWIYTDPLLGQANCPITVADGYAYTGFWNTDENNASFVCLSLTDENPDTPDEAKSASWRHVQTGGFYWAGAYACRDFVLVGTDDGQNGCTSETGEILLLDAKTGELLGRQGGLRGDVRSSICYDTKTDAYYAASKGGEFIQIRLEQENGRWKLGTCRTLLLENGTDSTPMSTSTPVVYNGRAYIGVSGSNQFGQYSGHNITVIDLKEWEIAYTVPTKGYPQTSGLLTTAYEGKDHKGYVYVYFFDNYTPGILRVLRDSAGQDEPDTVYRTAELYQGKSYSAAYALFTPVKPEAQYAICSPVVDENGTIYFKNDSACLMAFGSALKGMTVVTMPEKTEYKAGEMFAPEGLTVNGEFVNGVTRDVTKTLTFPTTPVEEGDETASAAFGGSGAMSRMYHNTPDGQGGMTAGIETRSPALEIPIRVRSDAVTGRLGGLTCLYFSERGTLRVKGSFESGQTLVAACYHASGRMTLTRTLTETGEVTLDKSSARIRLFLLDGSGKLVCAAVAVKE